MEWIGAKRFVIILLILLNVILAVLNFREKEAFEMTSSQERAIFEVLSENGITLYTDLITNIKSIYRLEAKVPNYEKEDIELAFFDGQETKTSLGDNKTFKTLQQTLVLESDRGIFTDKSKQKGLTDLSREKAIKIAQKQMTKLERLFGECSLNSIAKNDDGWQISFYSKYKDTFIFSNKILFSVSDDGIYEINFTFCEIISDVQEDKKIFLADEILIAFMREWQKENPNKTATIQKFELGYYIMGTEDINTKTNLYLEPCYRIYVIEDNVSYLINAYTGKIFKKC